MLVSHLHKFIYTKTLKTAGTSVEGYFEKYCVDPSEATVAEEYRSQSVSPAGIIGARSGRAKQSEWWNHMPAVQMRKKLGQQIWSSYLKFCCVRNPYDKALSAFVWMETVGQFRAPEGLDMPGKFEHWLSTEGPPVDRNKYMIADKFCLDTVIRYETLQQDVARVSERLGLPWEPDRLPAFKRGVRPATMSVDRMYSPRARQIVEQAYAFELDHFEYSFPLETA